MSSELAGAGHQYKLSEVEAKQTHILQKVVITCARGSRNSACDGWQDKRTEQEATGFQAATEP